MSPRKCELLLVLSGRRDRNPAKRDPLDADIVAIPPTIPPGQQRVRHCAPAGVRLSNGEFEWSILQGVAQSNGATADTASQPAGSMAVLTTLEEVRDAVNRVAMSAQRLMSIYTPDLEPDIYEQTAFLEIMKRFVLARSFAKVRVILADAQRIVRDNNRFLAMARRLTSYIDIRMAPAGAAAPLPSYLIADDRALVFRSNAGSFDGVADFNNSTMARLHLNHFDEIWHSIGSEYTLRTAMR
jgi:hypothetical protein